MWIYAQRYYTKNKKTPILDTVSQILTYKTYVNLIFILIAKEYVLMCVHSSIDSSKLIINQKAINVYLLV